MAGSDDLASLFAAEPAAVLRGGQGQLLQFNPDTFENQVLFRGAVMPNVSVGAGVDALSMSVGDVVILAGFSSTDGGASSWWIIGRASVPPLSDPVTIKGGDLIVEQGGSFTARDGSAIRALYDNGIQAVRWGSMVFLGGQEPAGHGILVQDDDSTDIFHALREPDGRKVVVSGQVEPGNRIDSFVVYSETVQLGTDSTPSDLFVVRSDSVTMRSGTDAFFAADGGAVVIESSGQQVFVDHATVGSDDNCVISSTGLIRRVASSRRYKTDIRDLRVNPRTVLDLKPRTWRDRSDVAQNPDTDRWHVGLIAEEVEDAGLGAFVNYDSKGRPDSIQYDRLAVPLLELCRAQQTQLDALTAWAVTQGYQPPESPSIEPTVLPKRVPIDTTGPARPHPSLSDPPQDRTAPDS